MPIYEYQCGDCGKRTEIITGICDECDALQCKHCGSQSITKVPTVASIAMRYSRPAGRTCCGRDERCDTPPCSADGPCCKT